MKSVTSLGPSTPIAVPARQRRARHYPRAWSVVWGAFLLLLAFLSFLGFAWFTGKLLLTGDRLSGFIALGLLTVFAGARLLAFLNNRHLSCKLCHGPLLRERRCRMHPKATRIPGLSYRAATVVAALFTGGFRCMYCGTPYRIKK